MSNIDPDIWMPEPHAVVPSTMKGFRIVVCFAIHVPFKHIPGRYSKIPVDVEVVDIIDMDIIEELIQHRILPDEFSAVEFVA